MPERQKHPFPFHPFPKKKTVGTGGYGMNSPYPTRPIPDRAGTHGNGWERVGTGEGATRLTGSDKTPQPGHASRPAPGWQTRKTDTMKPTPIAAHEATEQALHALYETAHLLAMAVDCYNTEAAATGRKTSWQAQLLRPAYHRLTDALHALGADEWESPNWHVRPAQPPAPHWPGFGFDNVPF